MIDKKLFSSDVKKQHTVPRFLLANFGRGNKKKQIYTYDKLNGKMYLQSVYNATTRNLFYNIENISIESILGTIENDASSVIRKIIDNKSISNLTREEKEKISVFVLIQQSRTFNKLKSFEDMIEKFTNKLSSLGVSENIEEELFNMKQPSDIQQSFLEHILESVNYLQFILNKDWILLETTEENQFYISDNPITLHNDNKSTFLGNIGLEVKGIQIHLPLSSTLTLAFYCSSIKKDLEKSFYKVKNSIVNQVVIERMKDIFELITAFHTGKSLSIDIKNVTFLNSLQVLYAEQYIFNNINEFSLIKDMIINNNDLKFQGTRMRIN